MDTKVKVRYLSDWGGTGSAIFFSADSSSVIKLENLFRQIASGEIDVAEFNSLGFVEPYFGINIIAAAGVQDLGVEQTGDMFEWVVTRSEWENYAWLLSGFRDGREGHQYLHGYGYFYPIQIIVSVNEYPSDWSGWKEE